MKRPEIIPGDYFAVCDRTGFRLLASQCQKEWDNAFVWSKVWEVRQPQDYLKGIRDNMTVPIARPMTDPVFLTANQVKRTDL